MLNDVSVLVPRNAGGVLSEEYGKKSLTNGLYHWYAPPPVL